MAVSLLLVFAVGGGIYSQAGSVLGVLTQGGSAVTLDKVLDESFNLSLAGYLEGTQLKSTAVSGAPLVVASSTLVENLDSDLLDGQHGDYYLDWNNAANTPLFISSLDGVSNNEGDVDLVAGANVTITPDDVANTITIAASAGVGGWFDDGTVVRLETDTDKVGIGTTAPEGKLHVYTGSAGTVTAGANQDDFVVESNAASGGLSVLVPDSSFGIIAIGSPSDTAHGRILAGYNLGYTELRSSNDLIFNVGGSSRDFVVNENGYDADFRIESDTNANMLFVDAGNNRVGVGTATPGAKLDILSTASDQFRLSYNGTNYWDAYVESDGGLYLIGNGSSPEFYVLPGDDVFFDMNTNVFYIYGNPGGIGLALGTPAAEGGDLAVYRDASGNLQLLVDANAAQSATALTLYGGIEVQGTGDSYISGNLGIGTATPGQKLEVNGGVMLNTVTVQPACSSSTRGTLWFTQGGAGVADQLEVCAKDAGDAYAWRTIY